MTLSIKNLSLMIVCLLLIPLTSLASDSLSYDIQGIDGSALINVKTRLQLLQATTPTLTPNTISAFFRKAPKTIKSSLEPFGFFKSDVRAQLTHTGPNWIAHFKIYSGPSLIIKHIQLKVTGPGTNNPSMQKLIKNFPLQVGQVFNADLYDAAKQKLFTTANNKGYIKAVLEDKSLRINLQNDTANIILHFETNDCYYVGDIHFDEDSFTQEFLRRFLPFKENDPFSSKKLLKLQENLSNSHYFNEVNVSPDLENITDFHVPITIKLTPNKSQQYNVGLGYGTFTGPRLTLGTDLRHLTKTGHHFKMQLRLSKVISGLAAQYVIPGKNPLTDEYTIGANAQRFMPKNGSSTSQTLSIGQTKNIFGWKQSLTLNYLREYYDIYADLGKRSSRILYPSLDLSRMQTDNVLTPTRGYKVSLNLKAASKRFISHSTFVQTELAAKIIYSPTLNSRLIMRGDLGYTAVHDLSTMPLSLQFFAGGIESIRGFPYSYFGPGRYVKEGSIELQHRLKNDIFGAVFYDVGVADEHFNAPLGKGIGIGLIYYSVVGPIRGYVGLGRTAGQKHRVSFDFSVGPDL
jgi:translocation and assembly module TamA